MQCWLLLEWVGRWVPASHNGECPGLFTSVLAAREWVRRLYVMPEETWREEFERVRSRFYLMPVELPPPMRPVHELGEFVGRYEFVVPE